jgi:hypothetical protein
MVKKKYEPLRRVIISDVYDSKSSLPTTIEEILKKALAQVGQKERIVDVKTLSLSDNASCICIYVEKD